MVHEKKFYLNDGKTMASVDALAKELHSMSDDVYSHHVNDVKNDFASWIRHSLERDELADRIDGHIHRIEMELHVLRHLVHEDKPKTKKKTAPAKKVVAKKAPVKKVPVKKVAKPAAKKKTVAKKATPKKKTTSTVKKEAPAKKKTTSPKKSKK